MYDPSPQRGPETPGEKLFVQLLGMAISCFLLVELAQDFNPVKLSVLFFFLSWCPLLLLHELGHALMAAGLGTRVVMPAPVGESVSGASSAGAEGFGAPDRPKR